MTMTASSQLNPNKAPPLPFLKWAGGKRWLTRISSIVERIPLDARYVEPFLGSAAMFFHTRPSKALLNDFNPDLIETYRAIKTNWKDVAKALRRHQRLHLEIDNYYYDVRASSPKTPELRAARFIYLNRTCFNGLYRVNQKGEFNVPRGTKSTVVLDTDDFEAVSRTLMNTELIHGDFSTVIKRSGSGDFIFADPPYTVKHNHNGFIKYNEKLFSWEDQVRLHDELSLAADRGAAIMITNADHPSIHELYRRFDIIVAERPSVMASSSDKRKKTTEAIITINLL